MGLVSGYAQKLKMEYFINDLPKDARILEIGSGDGWLGRYLKENGYENYVSLDIVPPADYVCPIEEWREAGLEPNSFDVIVAFEVIEHVPCFKEMRDLLKPEGELFVTTPVPHLDWVCKILEAIGINQKRTSPHDFLIYFKDIPHFKVAQEWTVLFIGQWGRLKPIPE